MHASYDMIYTRRFILSHATLTAVLIVFVCLRRYYIAYSLYVPNTPRRVRVFVFLSYLHTGTVQEAATWGEVIVLATASFNDDEGIKSIAQSLGEGVAGKLVADGE